MTELYYNSQIVSYLSGLICVFKHLKQESCTPVDENVLSLIHETRAEPTFV